MNPRLPRARPVRVGSGLGRKPLYLLGTSRREIHARGESLHILATGAAAHSLPLARVARVVCGPGAEWDGSAVCACLTHGIPITFLDSRGEVAGTAIPHQIQPSPLHEALLLYVQGEHWHSRYHNWLRNRRMHVLTHWAAGLCPETRRAIRFNELKRCYVYQRWLPDHFVPEAHGWCASAVADTLLESGVDVQYWGFDGLSLDLSDDLAGLFWADLTLHCGTLAQQVEAGPAALLFFENWVQKNRGHIAQHLGDLKRHVHGENCSWH